VHEREEDKESVSSRVCFDFLDKTSRSFSAVIQELHPELLLPICLFYLILRGLDTIEDDTSIPAATKTPLLRDFHNKLEEDGWGFTGNRPEEKDRELLVQFKHVITEFKKIKPAYRETIQDITKKMGSGMADYINNAEFNEVGVDKVEDYDLYCHYVAGLVGEGLTRLFVESGYGNKALLDRPHLHESMGLFLQKTNIIRDIKEDSDDNRKFYPREIWSRHVDKFEDLFKPENQEAALNCSSEMVLNALQHADECLFYLAGLKEQSVFNFCAIPQSMAIATLELCFRNPKIFKQNIKITKGQACQLMVDSTQNLKLVCEVFRRHVRKIHKKNVPQDPNFLKISIACGKVEQFIESIFPSQRPDDARRSQPGELKTIKALEKEAQEKEARNDMFWMIMAMLFMLTIVSVSMVSHHHLPNSPSQLPILHSITDT
jgi:farnesyl-diphosphate farnesyltransferase